MHSDQIDEELLEENADPRIEQLKIQVK